jgi:hypothetical protein
LQDVYKLLPARKGASHEKRKSLRYTKKLPVESAGFRSMR